MNGTRIFKYDKNTRFLSEVSPAASVTKQSYNSKGIIDTQTDPKGNIINFEYDALGRMIKQ